MSLEEVISSSRETDEAVGGDVWEVTFLPCCW